MLTRVPLLYDYLFSNLASDCKKLKLNTESCGAEGNFDFPFVFDFIQVENRDCSTLVTDFLTKESFNLHFIKPSSIFDIQTTENEVYFVIKDGSLEGFSGSVKTWLICLDLFGKVSFHISTFILL